MLHKLATHSCNREYIIIVVIAVYVHELNILPSRTFIIKTWIQIAIRLLKQVQVIHKLMISTALQIRREKKTYGHLSFHQFPLEIGHNILTCYFVHYFFTSFLALKFFPPIHINFLRSNRQGWIALCPFIHKVQICNNMLKIYDILRRYFSYTKSCKNIKIIILSNL
jgi:hypothetical protein